MRQVYSYINTITERQWTDFERVTIKFNSVIHWILISKWLMGYNLTDNKQYNLHTIKYNITDNMQLYNITYIQSNKI